MQKSIAALKGKTKALDNAVGKEPTVKVRLRERGSSGKESEERWLHIRNAFLKRSVADQIQVIAESGRWHHRGLPVIYAGLSVAICAMEKLVHTGPIIPCDLVLVRLELPEASGLFEEVNPAGLPGWRDTPPGEASQNHGSGFLRSARALGLIVPSAVVPEAKSLVLNPAHPRFADLQMRIERAFTFDSRLRS